MKRKNAKQKPAPYQAIRELQGNDEFKKSVMRLRSFLERRGAMQAGFTLPNHLWIARRGGGINTLVEVFAEFLHGWTFGLKCGIFLLYITCLFGG